MRLSITHSDACVAKFNKMRGLPNSKSNSVWSMSMRHVTIVLLIASTTLAPSRVATADSNSIGLTITSDRNPNNSAIPKSVKYKLTGEHTFKNGLIFGSSFQYADPAFSESTKQNLEATVAYSIPLNSIFLLKGSAGIGGRWEQNPDTSFPYYVFRAAIAIKINEDITWDAVSFRYRNAFERSDNYDTPQIATGLTFKVDTQSSISLKIMRDWKEGEPSDMGVSFGVEKKF
jgi:hypothetical protein